MKAQPDITAIRGGSGHREAALHAAAPLLRGSSQWTERHHV
jgi:hypothetical protein